MAKSAALSTDDSLGSILVIRGQRVILAANVLNSPRAVAMSVYGVRAFIQQREVLAANGAILKRLAEIDKGLLLHDSALRDIYHRLQPLLQPPPDPPRKKIGF